MSGLFGKVAQNVKTRVKQFEASIDTSLTDGDVPEKRSIRRGAISSPEKSIIFPVRDTSPIVDGEGDASDLSVAKAGTPQLESIVGLDGNSIRETPERPHRENTKAATQSKDLDIHANSDHNTMSKVTGVQAAGQHMAGQISTLTSKNKELELNVMELSEKVIEALDRAAAAESETETLKLEFSGLLGKEQRKVNALQKELGTYRDMEAKVTAAVAASEKAQAELKEKQAEVVDWQKREDRLRRQLNTLQSMYKKIEQRDEEGQRQGEATLGRLEEATLRAAELKKAADVAGKDRSSAEARIEELVEESARLREKAAESKAELDSQRVEVSRLRVVQRRQELAAQKKADEIRNELNTNYQHEIKRLTAGNAALSSEVAALKAGTEAEATAAATRERSLHGEIGRLRTELARDAQDKTHGRGQAEVAAATSVLNGQLQEIAGLLDEKEKAYSALSETYANEKRIAAVRAAQAETRLAEDSELIATLRGELDTLRAEARREGSAVSDEPAAAAPAEKPPSSPSASDEVRANDEAVASRGREMEERLLVRERELAALRLEVVELRRQGAVVGGAAAAGGGRLVVDRLLKAHADKQSAHDPASILNTSVPAFRLPSPLGPLSAELPPPPPVTPRARAVTEQLQEENTYLTEELVAVSKELDRANEKAKDVRALETQYADLKMRFDSLLQLMGEKEEENEELKHDVCDLKEAYQSQISELADRLNAANG